MTLTQSLSTCFRKYLNFKGRASRSEFWWFLIFANVLGLGIILEFASKILNLHYLVVILIVLAIIPPYLSVSVRRMHDINRSGWWVGVAVITGKVPIIWIVILVMACFRGTPEANKYGEPVETCRVKKNLIDETTRIEPTTIRLKFMDKIADFFKTATWTIIEFIGLGMSYLFGRVLILLGIAVIFLPFLGLPYWFWMSIQLGSFPMFFIGFVAPLWVIIAPVGAWSFFMGTPDWIISIFG